MIGSFFRHLRDQFTALPIAEVNLARQGVAADLDKCVKTRENPPSPERCKDQAMLISIAFS